FHLSFKRGMFVVARLELGAIRIDGVGLAMNMDEHGTGAEFRLRNHAHLPGGEIMIRDELRFGSSKPTREKCLHDCVDYEIEHSVRLYSPNLMNLPER
ncbi:MAG: hypothetical protein K0R17_3978, partial [Rariglobus sp.]|nr:hypothetical protein [Rariglobus sp.]